MVPDKHSGGVHSSAFLHQKHGVVRLAWEWTPLLISIPPAKHVEFVSSSRMYRSYLGYRVTFIQITVGKYKQGGVPLPCKSHHSMGYLLQLEFIEWVDIYSTNEPVIS